MLICSSNLNKFPFALVFGQSINAVDLCLIKILALVSLHLQFFGSSYDIFTKTGRIGLSPKFQVSLVLDKIGDLIFATNLIVLEVDFGFVFFIKNVLLCLIFPMVQESGHFDLLRGSYNHLNMYCSFGHFFKFRLWSSEFKHNLGQVGDSFWAWSLHEKWGILTLGSSPVGHIPIGEIHFYLWFKNYTGLIVSQNLHENTLLIFNSSNLPNFNGYS